MVRVHIVLGERHEQEDARLTDVETNIPCGLIERQSKLWWYFFSKIPLPKFGPDPDFRPSPEEDGPLKKGPALSPRTLREN